MGMCVYWLYYLSLQDSFAFVILSCFLLFIFILPSSILCHLLVSFFFSCSQFLFIFSLVFLSLSDICFIFPYTHWPFSIFSLKLQRMGCMWLDFYPPFLFLCLLLCLLFTWTGYGSSLSKAEPFYSEIVDCVEGRETVLLFSHLFWRGCPIYY